mgnify:CR=1 FL=1
MNLEPIAGLTAEEQWRIVMSGKCHAAMTNCGKLVAVAKTASCDAAVELATVLSKQWPSFVFNVNDDVVSMMHSAPVRQGADGYPVPNAA